MLQALRDRYLRIDARSLGLFRLVFGAVLIADLFRRWMWLQTFYSNEGVLPNHNHLFNLKETGHVWSLLHACSTVGENHTAFGVFLIVYLLFFLGWRTRVFHVLSLVALVSLTGRNILLENAGSYAAIALCAFTAFLPCGRRFSIDAMVTAMRARSEKNAAELNDRTGEEPDLGVAAFGTGDRAPGYSPTSLAALAVVLQIALIYLCTALQQSGQPWKDGTALHYALYSDRWVSDIGVAVRERGYEGVLSGLTHLVWTAQWAIPVLLFIPVFRRVSRGAAAALMVVHALVLGLLLSLGLYAWTLLAAAALVIPAESWDAGRARAAKKLPITVIYDADCGVCLWLARLLARLDLRRRVRFMGNDQIPSEGEGAPPATAMANELRLPAEVTPELADRTIIVIDARGQAYTRAEAIGAILSVLPLCTPIALIFRIPGIADLLDWLYDLVAARRFRISELCGFAACGIPQPGAEAEDPRPLPDAPSTLVRKRAAAGLRELAVLVVLAAMLGQTAHENPLPIAFPRPDALAAVALWPRMIARWDMLAPAPPLQAEGLVVDAQTRGGASIDPFSSKEPEFDLSKRKTNAGQLAGDFVYRIHLKEWEPFQKAFRDAISKMRTSDAADDAISGFDAYWVTQPIPAPGEASGGAESTRTKIFTYSRGGRAGGLPKLPMLPPDTIKLQRK